MSLPASDRAKIQAKHRIKAAMVNHLNDAIAAMLAGDAWATPPSLPGLVEISGSADPNAVIHCHPEQPDALVRNYPVWVYAHEDGPATIVSRATSGLAGYKTTQTQDYRVTLVFRYAADAVIDEFGAKPSPDEVMQHRADLYFGAVSNIMRQRVPGNVDVQDVELITDEYQSLYNEQYTIIGLTTSLWRLTQVVVTPTRICS